MKDRFCFWSIVRGASKLPARELVHSARHVGLFKDFHFWTDGPIEGAICHQLAKNLTRGPLAPLHLLRKSLGKLQYDYFVWLDPETVVTRGPGDVLRVLRGAPVHASLEHDVTVGSSLRPDWGPCCLPNFTKLMAFNGVHSHSIFTVNDGFWIVHHDVLERFSQLASDFWWFCRQAGYRLGFPPLLAYVTQMMCGNPYWHLLKDSADLWAPARPHRGAASANKNGGWDYVNAFTGEIHPVKPAMIHPVSRRHLAYA